MSDQDVALKVRGLLATITSDFDAVKVEVEAGVVYLEGIIASPGLRLNIERAVLRLPGVRQVVNCLATEHLADLPSGSRAFPFPHHGPRNLTHRRSAPR